MLQANAELEAISTGIGKWKRYIKLRLILKNKDVVTLRALLLGRWGIIAWRAPWHKWEK